MSHWHRTPRGLVKTIASKGGVRQVRRFDHELPETSAHLASRGVIFEISDTLQPENWRTFDNAAGEP